MYGVWDLLHLRVEQDKIGSLNRVSKQPRPNDNIRPEILAVPRNLAFYRTLDRLLSSKGCIYRHNACITFAVVERT